MALPVQRLATGWKVLGSNSRGAEIFAPAQTGPGAYTASSTMGIGVFREGKAAGAWR